MAYSYLFRVLFFCKKYTGVQNFKKYNEHTKSIRMVWNEKPFLIWVRPVRHRNSTHQTRTLDRMNFILATSAKSSCIKYATQMMINFFSNWISIAIDLIASVNLHCRIILTISTKYEVLQKKYNKSGPDLTCPGP